jgi:hypothetical protein
MSATTKLLVLSLAASVAAQGEGGGDLSSYDLATLRRMVHVRGLSCTGCTEDEYRSLARANRVRCGTAPEGMRNPRSRSAAVHHPRSQALPIDEVLAVDYDEIVAYQKKVEALGMSRADFMDQMIADDERSADDKRAERMWNYFQEQLVSGGVVFLANGTVKFSLPLTHHVSPYLPDAVADAIEDAFLTCRAGYMHVPHRYRRRLEARLESFVDAGGVHGILLVFVTLLLVDIGVESARRRSESSTIASGETVKG